MLRAEVYDRATRRCTSSNIKVRISSPENKMKKKFEWIEHGSLYIKDGLYRIRPVRILRRRHPFSYIVNPAG